MRRDKSFKHGRALPALVAGVIGYLIGGWHPVAFATRTSLSAADAVALRFPQQWDGATPAAAGAVGAADVSSAAATLDTSATTAATHRTDDAELALLDPQPMVPLTAPQAAPQATQDSVPGAAGQVAAAEDAGSSRALAAPETPRKMPPRAVAAQPARLIRASTLAVQRRPMDRPGYVLDDAQIASIKARLNLTPDQEQMWPAVEAALRNIAYTRGQEARRRNGLPGSTPVAFDPEAVEGLKSAAVPLIMSFNDEQKQEVRNLAHVMGLDQLAAQF